MGKRLTARDRKAVGLIPGQFMTIRREVIQDIAGNRPVTFWHDNCPVICEPPRFASKSHIAWIGKTPGRPHGQSGEQKMVRAYRREIATGLMTVAMALPLISNSGGYTQWDNATALALTVAGSQGSNAGLTVAMPVSDAADNHADKPRRRGLVHRKRTGF